MGKLNGKVAVVTGASKGIGAEIAKALGAEGASVVVNYATSKVGADQVVAAIAAKGGKAVSVQGDVSKEADITRLFKETRRVYGKLDILVNNAGVYSFAPLEQITPELFHKQFDLNVLGLLLTTKEAAKYFDGDGGSVINISSAVTTLYPPGSATYTATKAAVDAITVILSRELGPKGVRVNAINPGLVETEGVQSAGFIGSDFQKDIEAQTPLGRIGKPDDIAPAAVYLASADAKYVTGQTLNISGGIR